MALGSLAKLARRKPSLTERTDLISETVGVPALTEVRFDWLTFVVAQLVIHKSRVRRAMFWIGFNGMLSLQILIIDQCGRGPRRCTRQKVSLASLVKSLY